MKVWAHTLVKNEARWLWYSVVSVMDFVDRILLWDTGSSDNTRKIIDEILKRYPDKVEFKEVGPVDPKKFSLIRQQMLEKTNADWIILVDGDEVWWADSIRKLTDTIRKKGNALETIVSPSYTIVGDIYHYQEEEAGQYKIDGRKGHLNIRAMNIKIPGLHVEKPHGSQGYYDGNNVSVQERNRDKRIFLDCPYMHFTNVRRSASRRGDYLVPKRRMKLKYEFGNPFPKDFYYPEVFFKPRTEDIGSPWESMDIFFRLRSFIETPLRKAKRRLFRAGTGY